MKIKMSTQVSGRLEKKKAKEHTFFKKLA